MESLKKLLFFPLASYFRFFASIRLRRWNPKVIVVTGSSGKTTVLHLIQTQIDKHVHYSLHANSAFGIPFDILGMHRDSFKAYEWLTLFLKAPLLAFTRVPSAHTYIVEADCDRPGEGRFLATLLNPHVVLWVSSGRTHSMNFDTLVATGQFKTIEDAIAYEFGYFVEYAQELVVFGESTSHMLTQEKRTHVPTIRITDEYLEKYVPELDKTTYMIQGKKYVIPVLQPKEIWKGIAMTMGLLNHLELPISAFDGFTPPPGRTSVFKGVKGITIIDSSYNANLSSMKAVLGMYQSLDIKTKWAVIGDMLEQGESEREEHEKLAELLSPVDLKRVLFMGQLTTKYTMPLFMKANPHITVSAHPNALEILETLQLELTGSETILFKGGRFLEGTVEHLLQKKEAVTKLCRQEPSWKMKRKALGL